MMPTHSRWTAWAFGAFFALSLGACAKKQIVRQTPSSSSEAIPMVQAENPDVKSEELDIHGKDFESSQNLAAVHFDYDSSELSDNDRQILFKNSEYLKNQDLEVLVEGHCDQRGTVSYNLALGQKRAASVQKYYAALGVAPKRIGVISYGKEKNLCAQNTESCWAQNRRGETKVRTLRVAVDGGGVIPSPAK